MAIEITSTISITLDEYLKLSNVVSDKNIPQFSHNQFILFFTFPQLSFTKAYIIFKTSTTSGEEEISPSIVNSKYVYAWGVPQSATTYSGELKVWLVLQTISNNETTKLVYSTPLRFNIIKGEIGGDSITSVEISADEINAINNAQDSSELDDSRTIVLDSNYKITTNDYDKNVPQFSHNQVSIKVTYPSATFDGVSVIYKTRSGDYEQYLAPHSGDTNYVIWNIPQSATLNAGEVKFWIVFKNFTGTTIDNVIYSAPMVLNIIKGEIGSEIASTEVSSNTITEVQQLISSVISNTGARVFYTDTLPNKLLSGDLLLDND